MAPGAVIGGKYTVDSVLGTGSTGVVLKAIPIGSTMPVAVRLLDAQVMASPVFMERFFREAEVASQVLGEHLGAVLDAGLTAHGEAFLVTEFLEGEDVRSILARWGRFSPAHAVGYILNACAGLSVLHDARIVHKGLQPSSLFIVEAAGAAPLLKVTDFVSCKVDPTPIDDEMVYRAPEQLGARKSADARADIWALGAMLFEFLTGELPFDPSLAGVVAGGAAHAGRKTARSLLPTLPPAIDAIIDRCLAPDPEDRFGTVEELASALSKLRLESGAAIGPGAARQKAPSIGEVGELASLIMPERRATLRRAAESAPAAPVPPARALRTPAAMRPNDGVMRDLNFADAGSSLQLRTVPPKASAPNATSAFGTPLPTPAVRPPSGSRPDMRPPSGSRPDVRPPSGSRPDGAQMDAPSPRWAGLRARLQSNAKLLMFGGAGAASFVLLGALFVLVLLPRWVASSLRDTASGAGMVVTYESASFRMSGVSLTNVDATFPSLPGTTLHANDARSSFSGAEVVLSDVELVSQSPPEELVRFVRSAEALLPKGFRADDVHVVYTYARGVVLEGSGATVARGTEGSGTLDLRMPEANLKTNVGSIGAFAVDAKHDENQATLHVTPIGGAHPGAALDVTWTGPVTHVIAHAPRGVYALPAKPLGIGTADELDMACELDATWNEYGDAKGAGKVSLFGLTLGPVPQDLEWEFTLSGKSRALTMDNVRARLGPFSARIRGQWASSERRDAVFSFSTQAVPCADVARARAKQGDVPSLLASVVEFAGVAKLNGKASVAGAITISLDVPVGVKASLVENDTCGLAIFER